MVALAAQRTAPRFSAAPEEDFLRDVLEGLASEPKSVPSKYLYDAEGSRLFDRITELEEYYPTRTEQAIMAAHVDEVVEAIGPHALLVEYGSGSSMKTRLLLDRMDRPAGYVPVDISREHLLLAADRLAADYPGIPIFPVVADYTQEVSLPEVPRQVERVVVFFPGSTIGNFAPEEAVRFLRDASAVCGKEGALLIGVDLQKDEEMLVRAYDDAAGVTAAFNKNLLVRMNRELGADFDPGAFEHEAVYDAVAGRIEMYLVSRADQVVRVAGTSFALREGERICTEHSHKYTLAGFAAVASEAGLAVRRVWTDERRLFSVQLLAPDAGSDRAMARS